MIGPCTGMVLQVRMITPNILKLVKTVQEECMDRTLERVASYADENGYDIGDLVQKVKDVMLQEMKESVRSEKKILKKADPNRGPRKPTPYNIFIQEELIRIGTQEPALQPNERMKVAVKAWKARKAAAK